MPYEAIKHLHMTFAGLSIIGFVLRGVWMMRDSPMLGRRLVRILPHIIDTLLLVTAIALAVMIAQYPFFAAWITAKVVGLIAYVVLGMFALKYGRTKPVRIVAFFAAIVVFAWIVSVAIMKNPAGFLA